MDELMYGGDVLAAVRNLIKDEAEKYIFDPADESYWVDKILGSEIAPGWFVRSVEHVDGARYNLVVEGPPQVKVNFNMGSIDE